MLGQGALGELALGQPEELGARPIYLVAETATFTIFASNNIVVAGTGAFTITCNNVSGVRASSVLNAAPGSVSLSGVGATLLYGWTMAVAAGAFNVTTVNAAYILKLPAAVYPLRVTGVNASLNHLLVPLSPAAGAFSLSAYAANFEIFFGIDPVAGAINVVGGATSLFTTRFLRAATGGFAFNAGSAVLTHVRPFNILTGSYTVSSVATGLQVTHRMTARFGYYWLVGVAAYPQKIGWLSLNPAAFTISGAATLSYGVQLSCASGGFVVAGNGATVARRYTLNAIAGWYLVTPHAASSYKSHVLSAVAGSYLIEDDAIRMGNNRPFYALSVAVTINEQPVVLQRTRVLNTRVGAFTLTSKNVYTYSASGASEFVWEAPAAQAAWAPRAKVLQIQWLQ